MARPPAPPDEPPTGAMKKQGGYPGRVLVVPLLVFRVPEGERSVLSAAQIKFVTLVVRRAQRAPLEPNLPTGPLVSRYWLRGTPSRADGATVVNLNGVIGHCRLSQHRRLTSLIGCTINLKVTKHVGEPTLPLCGTQWYYSA